MTIRRVTSLVLGAAAFVALSFAASPGWSNGTLAVGLPKDAAKDGFAVGISFNYKTNAEADKEALRQCRGFEGVPASTTALCKVLQHWKDQCVAIAMDPEPGTYGVGWMIGATQNAADKGALAKCIKTSHSDRKNFCQVTFRKCEGKVATETYNVTPTQSPKGNTGGGGSKQH